MDLNTAQTVFTLFYAICWGTAANVQPRWGAFAYPSMFEPKPNGRKAAIRIALSWILLNGVAVCFFVWVLGHLNGSAWRQVNLYPWSPGAYWRIVLAIVPALATFGLYKLWLGIVQMAYQCCFTDREVKRLQKDHCDRAFEGGWVNIIFGIALIVVAAISATS